VVTESHCPQMVVARLPTVAVGAAAARPAKRMEIVEDFMAGDVYRFCKKCSDGRASHYLISDTRNSLYIFGYLPLLHDLSHLLYVHPHRAPGLIALSGAHREPPKSLKAYGRAHLAHFHSPPRYALDSCVF
jgi:hypothetical protein